MHLLMIIKILLLLQQFSMCEEIKSERIKNRKWIISNFQIFIQFPPGPPAGCSTWGLCSRPWSPREVLFVLRVIIFGMVSLFYLFLFLYCQLLDEMTYIIYEVSKDDMRFQRYFFLSNCVVFAHFLSLNRDRRYPHFFLFIFLSKEKKGKPIIAIIHCCCRGAQLSHKFSKIPQLEVDETCIWHPGVLGKLGPGKSGPSLIWRQIGPHTFWCCGKLGPGKLGPARLGTPGQRTYPTTK